MPRYQKLDRIDDLNNASRFFDPIAPAWRSNMNVLTEQHIFNASSSNVDPGTRKNVPFWYTQANYVGSWRFQNRSGRDAEQATAIMNENNALAFGDEDVYLGIDHNDRTARQWPRAVGAANASNEPGRVINPLIDGRIDRPGRYDGLPQTMDLNASARNRRRVNLTDFDTPYEIKNHLLTVLAPPIVNGVPANAMWGSLLTSATQFAFMLKARGVYVVWKASEVPRAPGETPTLEMYEIPVEQCFRASLRYAKPGF